MSIREKKPGWKSIPIACTILEAGSSAKYKTGEWRVASRPVINQEKCTGCLICWIYCPEPAILRVEKGVEIDYDYCKGCGVCASECPVKAISMEEEHR